MRVVLREVGQVEAHLLPLLHVFDGEVEPEDVTSCVGIDPEEEIVLALADLHHAVQVPALEPRLKREFLLQVDRRVHALEGAVVDLVLVELVVDHRILSYSRVTCRKLVFLLTFRSLKS